MRPRDWDNALKFTLLSSVSRTSQERFIWDHLLALIDTLSVELCGVPRNRPPGSPSAAPQRHGVCPKQNRPTDFSIGRRSGLYCHREVGMRAATPSEPARPEKVYRLKNSAGGHSGPRSYFNP